MNVSIDIPDPLEPYRKKLVSQIANVTEHVIERCAPSPESPERVIVRQAVTMATDAVLKVLDGGEELLSPSYMPGYCVLPVTMVKCQGDRPNLAGGLSEAYLNLFEDINN